ncbi:transglutaminase-like domain-containing protein [Caproiciproducens sp. MSJ-32]|uniref:transglutaminase-like domain-containing protein n=1 Tax=Caproiciproducens sp. MSJ-32 TaxID=2841527 RepID=UPI001C112E43|nr:transglutaminase-like domain-containing protein [Caproiciproducens sp. MSJ-32]MBU5453964.1 transglutaminase-like domain-containing protein [Caproiciproducens sp. MSJ-32]
MQEYVSYFLCGVIILFSIISSVKSSLEEKSIRDSLNKLYYYFSIFLAFFILILNLEKIYLFALQSLSAYVSTNGLNNILFKVVILGIIFIFIQNIIYFALKVINNIIFTPYENKRARKFGIIIFSSFFGFLKGLVIILMMFITVSTYNITLGSNNKIEIFNNINGYNSLENIILVNKPVLSYDDFKEYLPKNPNVIVYYNGVTLEEGVKSSDQIDLKAEEIIKGAENDREKARRIYAWIGSNISYDFDKAKKVLSEEGVSNSGAIEAFNTRRGICFDYACLFTAMARATNLRSRIITGEAYDGVNFGPHAWNQVYLEDEGVWINIDSTFYMAGDYFDNSDFNKDHLNGEIAGEF